jgi:hypothetical protein
MTMPDKKRPDTDKPEREQRPYPHGSGDRNAWSPTRKDPMPRHEGGTQRKAPPEPDSPA